MGACVLFGWAWKLVVFWDACNYSPPVVFFTWHVSHENFKSFSPLLAPLTFPQRTVSLRSFLKGFSHCSFNFYFTLSSCHSQLLTLNIFMHCFPGVYYNGGTFPAVVPAVLLSVLFLPFIQPSFTLCWKMDGLNKVVNESMNDFICVTERKRREKVWLSVFCTCLCVVRVCDRVVNDCVCHLAHHGLSHRQTYSI